MNKQDFIDECIRNRKYLEFTIKDMCNCLIDMSEADYEAFEEGKKDLTVENIKRVVKVLCIKNKSFNLNDYIDTNDLDDDSILDLEEVVKAIVGAGND